MTDTLYDADRPFGLPVKTRLIVSNDDGEAEAISGHVYEPADPRDGTPAHALDTYLRRQD